MHSRQKKFSLQHNFFILKFILAASYIRSVEKICIFIFIFIQRNNMNASLYINKNTTVSR